MKQALSFGQCNVLGLSLWLVTGGMQVQAFEWQYDELTARANFSVSYGIGWRLEAADQRHVYSANKVGGRASSYNFDDGNLNYEAGDVYTSVLKGTAELELEYQNYGAFTRVRGFYDQVVENEVPNFKRYSDETKESAGKGYDLLDAYIWADFDAGEMPLTLRFGRQVLSWGESTFIQGGINSVNPIDASAARKPGVELKEVLLPVSLFYASLGVTSNVTLEGFYQIQWEKTRPDSCGTLFATADFVADGCAPVYLQGSIDERLLDEQRDAELGLPFSQRSVPVAERLPDNRAKNDGQYGIALRWYAEALWDTDLGFYFMNLHSRLPLINGVVANPSGSPSSVAGRIESQYPQYFIEYPEDIKYYGISFSRSLESGATLSGEISYKKDVPLQWNSFDLLIAGLNGKVSKLYLDRLAELQKDGLTESQAINQLKGSTAEGYDLYDVWQAQMTWIQFYDQVMGANRVSVATEVGVIYVEDLPDYDDARYGRSGSLGVGKTDDVYVVGEDACLAGRPGSGSFANVTPANCTDDGYVDQWSGGIRMRINWEYNNAFAGVNMIPNTAIGYDIGNAPEPGAQFIDQRFTLGLGVKFNYLNRYYASMDYARFHGKGKYYVQHDRDNISLTVGASF